MDPATILSVVLQLLALFPSIEPAAVKAVEDFKAMLAGGATPTQADIDALISKAQAQSQTIQGLT